MYDLAELGLQEDLKKKFESQQIDPSRIFRVIKEHKELYAILNLHGTYQAEITGNMRYMAESREDFPAVGDWVEANVYDGEKAIILGILPRYSTLERQSVAMHGEKQLMAANIDTAFLVQAVDRDFNLNRLERYLVIACDGGVEPVVVLNKIDLIPESQVRKMVDDISARLKNVTTITTSVSSGQGLDTLRGHLVKGRTYCFLGSSGVGKSSIINFLIGNETLETREISGATNKGKHTTTSRQLVLLDNGSILVDTPGMREIGLAESTGGLELTFSEITDLAKECKFKDCTHTYEPGCRVLEAIENGQLGIDELENYKKLERQAAHFSATVAEKRKRDKSFGKMCRNIVKSRKKHKF